MLWKSITNTHYNNNIIAHTISLSRKFDSLLPPHTHLYITQSSILWTFLFIQKFLSFCILVFFFICFSFFIFFLMRKMENVVLCSFHLFSQFIFYSLPLYLYLTHIHMHLYNFWRCFYILNLYSIVLLMQENPIFLYTETNFDIILFFLQEVVLPKNQGSLGFSIIGGTDHSCVPFGANEPGIFISHVSLSNKQLFLFCLNK